MAAQRERIFGMSFRERSKSDFVRLWVRLPLSKKGFTVYCDSSCPARKSSPLVVWVMQYDRKHDMVATPKMLTLPFLESRNSFSPDLVALFFLRWLFLVTVLVTVSLVMKMKRQGKEVDVNQDHQQYREITHHHLEVVLFVCMPIQLPLFSCLWCIIVFICTPF